MRTKTLKKKAVSRQQRAAAIIILAITLVVTYALVAVSIIPVRYEIEAGEVAPATITASREVIDDVSTEAAVAEARAAVDPVYSEDKNITAEIKQGVSDFFDSAEQVPDYIKDTYLAARSVLTGLTEEELEKSYNADRIDWSNSLTSDMKEYIKSIPSLSGISDDIIIELAGSTAEEISGIAQNVLEITEHSLSGGIMEDELQTEKNAAQREIAGLYTDEGIKRLAFYPVDSYFKANKVFDAAATATAMNLAEAAVDPVTYKKNQIVVTEGEVVTDAQLSVLKELGILGVASDYELYIGMFVFLALLFVIYTIYLFQFDTEVLSETRKLIMICIITVIIVALAVPLTRLDSRIVTAFFGTMLASVLVSQRSALAFNVFLAFIVGAVCSWESGILSDTMLRTVMITVIGGSAAVYALYRPGYRASLIYAGLIAGGAGVIIIALTDIMATSLSTDEILIDSAFAVGSGLFGGVLAIGTLPIWEAVFRVSTPAKLIELSDPNHPLLKRMTVEAPGTYHHSILTANLAEAGADALGANALLCRVGAYYHDVGKLKNPEYFKENQKDENPHNELDPRESAKIITEHLTYGMELARKFKLPRDIQKIMAQHHGDTTVPYFLHKAQEAGIEVDEALFRYKGTKPSTKESAVVMLADCVEAAVRSIDNPDREQIKDMVSKIIRGKYNEGQLDDCPLSRRDLNALAKAFLGVYDGAFHERIKYPGQE